MSIVVSVIEHIDSLQEQVKLFAGRKPDPISQDVTKLH